MEATRQLAVIKERATALIAAARQDLDSTVPSCPGWTVADLVGHIGVAWQWAASTVESGVRNDFAEPPPGISDERLLEWATTAASRLHQVLGAADLDANCWTFGLPRTPRFWLRRQCLETTLHAWDVEQAVGAPAALDPEVASDGVDEYLTVLVPRWVGRNPGTWSGESFHLHRTDGDGEWIVRLGPDGQVDARRVHEKGDVGLRGPAASLWLWCTGRRPVGTDPALDVVGDAPLAGRWAAEITF